MDLFSPSKVLYSIVKANIYATLIILIVYVFEVSFNLKIFIKYFTWKKSRRNAEIAADGNTGYYVIFCCGVFIYDILNGFIAFNFANVVFWLTIMTILALTFHKLYSKYQGVDPNKRDDDFT